MNVTRSLKGTDLPSDRRYIVDVAKEEDAPREVLHQLEEMLYGRYHTMEEVIGAIGD